VDSAVQREKRPRVNPANSDGIARTRGSLVIRNVSLNFVSQVWFAALAIVTTPYIVRELGPDLYGLYILVAAILGYFSFLDLGLGAALTKYVAQYDAVHDRAAVTRILRTACAAYVVLGGVGALILAAVTPWLVEHVFSIPPSDQQTARAGFYLAALGFLVNLPSQTFGIVPTALQRFDYVVGRTIFFGSLAILATVAVLAMGYGLREVFIVNLLITLATAVSFYVVARRLLPWVRFSPRVYKSELRTLLTFGVLKASQRLAVQIVIQLDRVVVGAVFPISALAYYAVPLSLSQRILRVGWNVGIAIFPAASALAGASDDRRLKDLYLRSMKLTALLSCSTSAIMFFYAHQIMRYWIGAGFENHSSRILMILAIANLFFGFTTAPGLILEANNRIRISTLFAWISAAANIVLLAALVPIIGLEGAAWAVFANAATQVPLFLYYAHTRVLDVGLGELVRESLAKPLVSVAVLAPLMIWARTRVENLGELAGLCIATIICYFAVTVLIGTYDVRDRTAVRTLLRRRRA
jgi:O-antigen/teichoic acid export membrane protein